jgi:riboflavin kinase/FMN adenylyltransferase
MQIVTKVEPGITQGSSVAVGFFDGVHKGHQAVIRRAVDDAVKLGVPACAVTFQQHPQQVIESKKAPELLTTLEQRLRYFEQLGIGLTLALPFSKDISHLDPTEYVQKIFIATLGVQSVSVGYNHHFAHNRQGTPVLLQELGKKFNFQVHIMERVYVDGAEASSSSIRGALKEGNLGLANKLLGRHYAVSGLVVAGQGRGRQVTGFPTANLKLEEYQLIPLDGVYAGTTVLDGRSYPCAINIGCRPTVTSDRTPTIEVHILNFDNDIYGNQLEVELWEYLRPEQKFAGIDALKEQINKDCLRVDELVKCGSSTYD